MQPTGLSLHLRIQAFQKYQNCQMLLQSHPEIHLRRILQQPRLRLSRLQPLLHRPLYQLQLQQQQNLQPPSQRRNRQHLRLFRRQMRLQWHRWRQLCLSRRRQQWYLTGLSTGSVSSVVWFSQSVWWLSPVLRSNFTEPVKGIPIISLYRYRYAIHYSLIRQRVLGFYFLHHFCAMLRLSCVCCWMPSWRWWDLSSRNAATTELL